MQQHPKEWHINQLNCGTTELSHRFLPHVSRLAELLPSKTDSIWKNTTLNTNTATFRHHTQSRAKEMLSTSCHRNFSCCTFLQSLCCMRSKKTTCMFNHKKVLEHYVVQALSQKAVVDEEENKQ